MERRSDSFLWWRDNSLEREGRKARPTPTDLRSVPAEVHAFESHPSHPIIYTRSWGNIFYQKGKVVAAICLATVVLARAGILKGKKATYYDSPVSFREMKAAGAVITNAPVVRDARVITANGPSASKAFADEIVHALTAVEW